MIFLKKEKIKEFFNYIDITNFNKIVQDFINDENNYVLKFVINGNDDYSYEQRISLINFNKKEILDGLKEFLINKNFIDSNLKPISLEEDNLYIFEDNIVYIDIYINVENSVLLYGTYDNDGFDEKYEII